ncbi:enoyl-CoA hydratase/isomerase family protein [Baekduia soli]|uniref:enoyl-CoA hydratase n=1 Tax=Baekduia soli TaxID=496014 RepID=A0A5B8U5C9_9ACTN|nr:enoyl-CoA hydratase/isomerase family protein [Baekduia soli]QEC48085.1 enoyl-CoA hydratase/isomerase family protein [Baekduia soli]
MASDPWVRVEHDDGVAQVVLERPPVNQFDDAFVCMVRDAVLALGPHTRAVVVRSAVPRMFAAGGDIPWMARVSIEEQLEFVRHCQDAYSAFERTPAPTIAAVDGPAMGGGFELALCCDIRVVGESARLGLPEATIGLIAGAGGTQRLVRAVGQGVARDLLLTGRRITGVEAGAMGIASRVVPDGTAAEVALDIARRLADGPAEAIQATKRLAVLAPDVTIEEGLARERAEWEAVRRSAATQEGLEAFAEKRRPDFRGAAQR